MSNIKCYLTTISKQTAHMYIKLYTLQKHFRILYNNVVDTCVALQGLYMHEVAIVRADMYQLICKCHRDRTYIHACMVIVNTYLPVRSLYRSAT